MEELAKIKRIIERENPNGVQEVLLALDATTGQNALIQAKQFNEATEITGLVLTKLDGTAKGGVVLSIRYELDIPVKYIGLGEKATDLKKFDAEAYMYSWVKDVLEVKHLDRERLGQPSLFFNGDEVAAIWIIAILRKTLLACGIFLG